MHWFAQWIAFEQQAVELAGEAPDHGGLQA